MNNLALKILLWLPYTLTMLYFIVFTLTLKIRYTIPIDEYYYVIIAILMYSLFMDLSEYVRNKYWKLTKL